MKIIKKLNKDELIKKYKKQRDFNWINEALNKWNFYSAELNLDEFSKLIINSSFTKPVVIDEKDYPSIREAIDQILSNPDYLNITHEDRGISGTTVKQYLDKMKDGLQFNDAIVGEWGDTYYVYDAMHRLVSYGVYTKMDPNKFPIQIILCTYRELQ